MPTFSFDPPKMVFRVPRILSLGLLILILTASGSFAAKNGLGKHIARGKQLFKAKRYVDAAKIWKKVGDLLHKNDRHKVPKIRKTMAGLRFMVARALMQAKRYQAATKYLRQTLSLQPDHKNARLLLGRLERANKIGPEEVGPYPNYPEAGDYVTSPSEPSLDEFPSSSGPKPKGGHTLVPPGNPPEVKIQGDAPAKPEDPEKALNLYYGVERKKRDKFDARNAYTEAFRYLGMGGESQLEKARMKAKEAYELGHSEYQLQLLAGQIQLKDENAPAALYHFQKALEDESQDHGLTYTWIGKAHGLQGEVSKEIDSYEKALQIAEQLDRDDGEAHFMLALAYDKVDNSPRVLEHAQKAIRIDPEYKEKLKPRIKDSNVSKKIGDIVSNVLKDSKFDRLTDEKIEEYADEIGRILGEENLNTDDLMGPNSRGKIKDALKGSNGDKRKFLNTLRKEIPKENQVKFLKEMKANKDLTKRLGDKLKEVKEKM